MWKDIDLYVGPTQKTKAILGGITMKKLFCIVLVLLVLLSACGQKEPPSASDSTPPPAPSQESSQPEGVDPALIAAVEEMIEQLNNGTADPGKTPELPEGFAFPEKLDWSSIQITNEEQGKYQITIPSVSTVSPRENVTIDGEEQAIFTWSSAAGLEEVWFSLARTEAVVPAHVDSDDLVKTAVAEMIEQYKNGTVTVNENIPALPEGFVFPEEPDLGKMDIDESGMMGVYQITVPSADREQTVTFFCHKFAVMDDNNNDTGDTECRVTHVLFQ